MNHSSTATTVTKTTTPTDMKTKILQKLRHLQRTLTISEISGSLGDLGKFNRDTKIALFALFNDLH
jgi:hypothetical protein